jgi:hypothetical protein
VVDDVAPITAPQQLHIVLRVLRPRQRMRSDPDLRIGDLVLHDDIR